MVNGLLVILTAQFFTSLKEVSLFDLMMQVSTLLQGPILVPLCFGMIIRKTPKWAPWATVLFGALVSWSIVNVFTPQVVAGWFGIDQLTGREISEFRTTITIAAHLIFTAGFFWATTLFYKEEQDANKEVCEQFFKDVETECVSEDGQYIVDRMQRNKLGTLVMYMAAGLTLMILIPNPLWGRILFLGCAASIFAIGYALKKSARLDSNGNKVITSTN